MDPALNGGWRGNFAMNIAGQPTNDSQGFVSIAVSGNSAVVTGLCDGNSSVNEVGSGGSAAWTGTLTCPPVNYTCPNEVFTYSTSTLDFVAPNLTIVFNGQVSGCGIVSFTDTFTTLIE